MQSSRSKHGSTPPGNWRRENLITAKCSFLLIRPESIAFGCPVLAEFFTARVEKLVYSNRAGSICFIQLADPHIAHRREQPGMNGLSERAGPSQRGNCGKQYHQAQRHPLPIFHAGEPPFAGHKSPYIRGNQPRDEGERPANGGP